MVGSATGAGCLAHIAGLWAPVSFTSATGVYVRSPDRADVVGDRCGETRRASSEVQYDRRRPTARHTIPSERCGITIPSPVAVGGHQPTAVILIFLLFNRNRSFGASKQFG